LRTSSAPGISTPRSVDEVLRQLHRMLTFLAGLPVKVFCQLRQVVIVNCTAIAVYCFVGGEFASDLYFKHRVELCFGSVVIDRVEHIIAAQSPSQRKQYLLSSGFSKQKAALS
jgi:hypothetical protein